jgi:hypothetical protein
MHIALVLEKHCSSALPSSRKTPPPEAPPPSAFPEYADLADKDGRDRLTIEHALTMRHQLGRE